MSNTAPRPPFRPLPAEADMLTKAGIVAAEAQKAVVALDEAAMALLGAINEAERLGLEVSIEQVAERWSRIGDSAGRMSTTDVRVQVLQRLR